MYKFRVKINITTTSPLFCCSVVHCSYYLLLLYVTTTSLTLNAPCFQAALQG